jgi:iron complex outermembrane receptor protein
MKHSFRLLTVLAMGIFLLVSGTAMGAESQEDASAKKQAHELGSVTVTAQKSEEEAQEVPVSMTVLGENDIEDMGIDSVIDLAHFAPNLMVFAEGVSGMNTPAIRGIHGFVESLTVSSGLFVDGIPILLPAGFEDMLLDIERVEVLRGPQGTLYGKNTEAGAINIITRKPDNDLRGKISVELGTDAKKEVALNLSGPLQKDKLFFGLSGSFYDKEGFIDNTYLDETANDRRHWYGKIYLRWTPVDRLDISFISSLLQYNDGGNSMSLGDYGASLYGLPAPQNRIVTSGFTGENESRTYAQALNISYNLSESLTLTSITTRKVYEDVGALDWDFTPAKLMHSYKDSEYSKISQELRLNSTGDKLKWLVGFYYDQDNNDIDASVDSDYPSMVSKTDREIDGNAYAIFGQASYAILPQLSLVMGLRYESQEMDFEDHVSGTVADNSWDDISPKVALEYSFTPDVMAYASVSKGFRSGGFNTYATDPEYTTYDAEKLWSYELGLKSSLLDKRLTVNAAVFFMDIEDMQVNQSITPYLSYITNAGGASAIGGEIEMRVELFDGLVFNASLGYCDIKFDEFSDAVGDYQDNHAPYAPDYTFNLGAQYRHRLGFFARVDLIGYGKMYFDKANTYSRDAFELVNAKIGYETEDFDIYLYGKNVFDTEYDSIGYYSGYYNIYSEPAEFGLKVVYRF